MVDNKNERRREGGVKREGKEKGNKRKRKGGKKERKEKER